MIVNLTSVDSLLRTKYSTCNKIKSINWSAVYSVWKIFLCWSISSLYWENDSTHLSRILNANSNIDSLFNFNASLIEMLGILFSFKINFNSAIFDDNFSELNGLSVNNRIGLNNVELFSNEPSW